MKRHQFAVAFVLLTALSACSGGGSKKVLIMSSGKIIVNENAPVTVKLEPGTTHNEKEILLTSADKETITVDGGQGNKTFDVTEPGYYVLNLKPDTLVGGLVRYGTGGRTSNLTAEDVDHIVDSTQQLLLGQNVNDNSKTYFIPPFTLKKLTAESGSKIIGPYNGVPNSVEADASGKSPEMYKLFTNKQKRESLNELIMERSKSKLRTVE